MPTGLFFCPRAGAGCKAPTHCGITADDWRGSARFPGRNLAAGPDTRPAATAAVRGSGGLAEPVVEGVTGAAYGADRIVVVAAVERLAQPADMHVDGALVDIDVAPPDAVEQLLAREDPSGPLHQELQQAVFGGPEIDRTAGPRHALLLPVDLDIAEAEDVGHAL